MQFPSTILAIFSRAFGGSLSPNDSVIQVTPEIKPVLEIPDGLRLIGTNGTLAFPVTVTRSFFLEATFDVNNGAGTSTTVAVITPGLWDLLFKVNFESNWTPLATNKISLQSVDEFAGAAVSVWFTLGMTATVQPTAVIPMRINYDHSMNVRLDTPASGVGQRHVISLSIFGNRLG
jgi:hypothetical protein